MVDVGGRIQSVFERLSARMKVDCHHFAKVSAHVTKCEVVGVTDWMLGTAHLCDQVGAVLALPEFPDLVSLWIGHNDLDWILKYPDGSLTESRCRALAENVASQFAVQLERLTASAKARRARTSVVVFGLVGFEKFFVARSQAELEKERHPRRYPYLEAGCRFFPSMKQEYRSGMIRLADAINGCLREMVSRIGADRESCLRVLYSSALTEAKIDQAEMLSAVDGWHPSIKGHSVLAECAFPVIYEAISQTRKFPHQCQDSDFRL